jgi:hypothetical protein
VIPVQPGTAVAPRFDGSAPDVLLRGNGRIVAIGFCNLAFAGSLREPGLDDPSGDSLAMEAAGRRYLRHGSVERPEPPRLAPHVYRAVHMLTVAFPGGGCMYLADPVVPDPAQGEASATGSPEDLEKAVRAAARRPLPAHLVEIAKQTTAYWGDSPRLPASNLRAEAIARRAQRAVMDSPRLRYDERQSLCRDQGDCRETEADEARLVEREAATGYVFADVTDESQGSRLLLVRTRQSVRRSSDGRCWDEDFYGGAPYGGFLFHGLFSHGYDRAAFFPPLRRWRLSYEPARPAGPATTELRWRSYFDRGRAVVENESLRILSMERVERAGPRTWTRRTVKFTYPASLKRVRAEPECRHETP